MAASEDLEKRIIDGKPQYYLLPGKRGQIGGCIEMDAVPPVGTQFWWGGLIHEFVEVANDSVDRISVDVGRAVTGPADDTADRWRSSS